MVREIHFPSRAVLEVVRSSSLLKLLITLSGLRSDFSFVKAPLVAAFSSIYPTHPTHERNKPPSHTCERRKDKNTRGGHCQGLLRPQ